MSCNNRNQSRPRVINADQVFIKADKVFIVDDNKRKRRNDVGGAEDIQRRNDRRNKDDHRDGNDVAGAQDDRRRKNRRCGWL